MAITLEKVDQVRERTGVSYQKAKETLEKTEGDVLEAIILIEEDKPNMDKFAQSASDFGNEVIKTLKDLLKQGNVTKIVVEKNDEIIMNLPVTVGALGAVFLTSATVVALIASLATGCEIKIHKENGEVVNVNDKAQEMMQKTKEKATEVYEKTKQHVNTNVCKEEPPVEEAPVEEAVAEETVEEAKNITIDVTEEDDEIKVEVIEE